MSAKSYIEESYEGGLSAYVASQNDRYAAALSSGNTDLIARLNADAARVGYSLNPMTVNNGGGGATSVSGGLIGSSAPVATFVSGGSGSAGSGEGGSRVGGMSGWLNNTVANIDGTNALSDLGVKSSFMELLPVVIIGAVIMFLVKVIFD